MDASLRAKLDQTGRHLTTTRAVHAHEQHLGYRELLTMIPSACPRALSRSRAKRCARTGTNTLMLALLSKSVGLGDVPRDRLPREDFGELVLQRLGRLRHADA